MANRIVNYFIDTLDCQSYSSDCRDVRHTECGIMCELSGDEIETTEAPKLRELTSEELDAVGGGGTTTTLGGITKGHGIAITNGGTNRNLASGAFVAP